MNSFLKQLITDWRTISVVVIGISILGALLYLDRNHRFTYFIRSWGATGVVVAVILMLLWCLTPIPSEGLLIIFLRVFGAFWGTLYAWLGTTLSALVIYFIARYFTKIWLKRASSHEKFEQINTWVQKWGSLGLLFARLLPVPAFVVNYAAGMIPAVNLWAYLWTAVLSIMPYYFGVALVFEGVVGNWLYILVGIIPLGIVGLIGILVKRRAHRSVNVDERSSWWH